MIEHTAHDWTHFHQAAAEMYRLKTVSVPEVLEPEGKGSGPF